MNKERFVHYKVGDSDIDSTHWILLTGLSDIVDSIKSKDNYPPMTEKLVIKFQTLLNTFNEHLMEEEGFMLDSKYPYIQYHMDEHKRMHTVINSSLVMLTEKPTTSSTINAANALGELFEYHIDYIDRQFFSWVQENNILLDKTK